MFPTELARITMQERERELGVMLRARAVLRGVAAAEARRRVALPDVRRRVLSFLLAR